MAQNSRVQYNRPMSFEPGAKGTGDTSEAHESLDLTGLPAPVADALRRLVGTLRSDLARSPSPQTDPATELPDQWAVRLQAWVDSHPTRPALIDDSRESLYAGRGE